MAYTRHYHLNNPLAVIMILHQLYWTCWTWTW